MKRASYRTAIEQYSEILHRVAIASIRDGSLLARELEQLECSNPKAEEMPTLIKQEKERLEQLLGMGHATAYKKSN